MFEVIVTHRADFREQLMGRFDTRGEAAASASQIIAQNFDLIFRAWVREIREVKAKS